MYACAVRPLVLSYHAVSDDWPSPLAVSQELLERQLTSLKRRGFSALTFADCERARQASALPPRSVVVTFDDAYSSTRLAKPVLDELGWTATVFAVTDFADSGRPLSWPGIEQWSGSAFAHELDPLRWDGLAALSGAGWEIGSHTASHPRLPDLGDAELRDELERSRAVVTERIGSCETIAYPYGAVDERVARASAAAGYLAACTLPISMRTDEPQLRPRVGLYSNDVGARFWLKTAPAPLAVRRTRLLRVIGRR